ncbi:MAG: hypothetical protein AAF202_07380 [Pseudomonadota bacterium]
MNLVPFGAQAGVQPQPGESYLEALSAAADSYLEKDLRERNVQAPAWYKAFHSTANAGTQILVGGLWVSTLPSPSEFRGIESVDRFFNLEIEMESAELLASARYIAMLEQGYEVEMAAHETRALQWVELRSRGQWQGSYAQYDGTQVPISELLQSYYKTLHQLLDSVDDHMQNQIGETLAIVTSRTEFEFDPSGYAETIAYFQDLPENPEQFKEKFSRSVNWLQRMTGQTLALFEKLRSIREAIEEAAVLRSSDLPAYSLRGFRSVQRLETARAAYELIPRALRAEWFGFPLVQADSAFPDFYRD